jgi:hypothetical protein
VTAPSALQVDAVGLETHGLVCGTKSLRRGFKQGSHPERGIGRQWFTWLAVAVVVLALICLKAFGIAAAAIIQPEVTMGIINCVFTKKVMFVAFVETAWSIGVNLLTNATSA